MIRSLRWTLLTLPLALLACGDDASGTDAGADAGGDGGVTHCDPAAPPNDNNLRASGGLFYTNPRFSPDGERILVLVWQGFSLNEIWSIDLCGERVETIAIADPLKAVSSWGPVEDSSGRVYFISDADEIRVRASGGTTTSTVVEDLFVPTFDVSVDGTRIATHLGSGIEVVGTNPGTGSVQGGQPRLSADGTRLLVKDDASLRLADVSDLDGSTIVATFNDVFDLKDADFEGNDGFVAATTAGIERVDLQGQRTVVFQDPLSRNVDVSPDGQWVAYGRNGQPEVVLRRLP